MSHIVDTLRKHQKLFVLGVALAVITLYMVPVDQLVQGVLSPKAQALQDKFDGIIKRLGDLNVDTRQHRTSAVQNSAFTRFAPPLGSRA